ncbi:MAG: hypothetical protein J1F20_03110 [Muribaculaceae bacterium]|nr:hypothetical protein [Muribaculaceae bacterium]
MQKYIVLLLLVFCSFHSRSQKWTVVADSDTHIPLPKASVFDNKGNFAGVTDAKGRLPLFSAKDYPLTIRYLGYGEEIVKSGDIDTVFMREFVTELPELIIETKKHNMLHVMAYVREYSTLSTLTDTISLFREKMVDYIKPVAKSKFQGWTNPRVLTTRSYYRFTNSEGLDSVSDRCGYHFSWTDWIGLPPSTPLPEALFKKDFATDTVYGKYSFTELWRKNKEKVSLDVDILADTVSRKWVPNLSLFFRKDVDFERFNVRFNFDNVFGNYLDETNVVGYSFNIESQGRGRGMFMFNRYDESFYVNTYCEVYIIDKEYITEKEARKWEKLTTGGENIDFFISPDAPELQPGIAALIVRVESIDHDKARMDSTPDLSNVGYRAERLSPGQQVLRRLKGILGIDKLNAKRKWDKNYKTFREKQRKRNKKE